jgi:hypothetical protein
LLQGRHHAHRRNIASPATLTLLTLTLTLTLLVLVLH